MLLLDTPALFNAIDFASDFDIREELEFELELEPLFLFVDGLVVVVLSSSPLYSSFFSFSSKTIFPVLAFISYSYS